MIPIYQRTYSWTEKECRQLWSDILRAGANDEISAHFIGSVVYVEKGLYSVSSQSPLLVIDGQQRLATVSLIIAALAKSKERIHRAAQKIRQEREGKLDLEGNGDLDLGFKVFKLDQSNFKQWQTPSAELSTEQLSQQLDLHTDHIDSYATQEEVFYELLLKAGFMPTEKVETLDLAGKQVFSIADGALLVCLEDAMTSELIDAVADLEPMQFICQDKGFKGNDQLKANAVQTFKSCSQNAETEMVFKVV